MPVRPKPKQYSAGPVDEKRINALIDQGGTVSTRRGRTAKTMLVQLRLAPDLIHRIDRSRGKRAVPPSRHAWMIEALLEKLA